jgi:type VI secretion system protein VasG
MSVVRAATVFDKLNATCENAINTAIGLSFRSRHASVDLEHVLLALADQRGTDIELLLRHFDISRDDVIADLRVVVDQPQPLGTSRPNISNGVKHLVRTAGDLAWYEYGSSKIRSGHILLALVAEDDLAASLRRPLDDALRGPSPKSEASRGMHLRKMLNLDSGELRKSLPTLTASSTEDEPAVSQAAQADRPVASAATTRALDQYTRDLTDVARRGGLDPVLGRDAEIRQLVDILIRRRQNNPILTGEAGVGKTAVVEGFALRVAAGDVPPSLRDVSVRTLDLGLLQAGAGVRGEFENRLKSVIQEVTSAPKPVILFIDEAHTLIGAGGQAGQGDAANLLKPALARGELRTIAATTWAEYKQYFEKDAALTRRFQVVKVDEPDEPLAVEMIRGLVGTLKQHHHVHILDEALRASVRLSKRYLSGRQLPDKAVSVLDTACAKVAISQVVTPPAVEDCRRRISQIATEVDLLERERLAGGKCKDRLDQLSCDREVATHRLAELEARWKDERRLVDQVCALNAKLDAHVAARKPPADTTDGRLSPDELAAIQAELARLNSELAGVQAESPLMHVCVDAQAVADVISGWTGIPVGKMVKNEITTALSLKQLLEERIVGQSHALDVISEHLITARGNLGNPGQPIGVFLLVGPSGVGKTETVLSLADLLYASDQNLIVINMSEFKEEHRVSVLMGAPPGYKGYGEGGVLTEAVRQRPYSVVLLDEIEKAHPGVHDNFLQVFDKGTLRDGDGRDINFKNTVIFMTSNAGSRTIHKFCAGSTTPPSPDKLAEALHYDLLSVFKEEFLGRAVVVPYYPLATDVLRKIVTIQLEKIGGRLLENHQARFTYDEKLVESIATRCTETEIGARNITHILSHTLLPDISRALLQRMAAGQATSSVHAMIGAQGGYEYTVA